MCLPGNDVVEQDSYNTADDGPKDGDDQAVFEVAGALALDGENGVRDTRAEVTCRVQRIAGQTAKGHTDGHDDAEDQQLADAGSQLRDLVQTADRENQNEGRDGFLHDVAAGVGDGRAGGEHAKLGAGVFRRVKVIFEEDVDQNAADDTFPFVSFNHIVLVVPLSACVLSKTLNWDLLQLINCSVLRSIPITETSSLL